MATHSSVLAWSIPADQGTCRATYSPRGRKESTQLRDQHFHCCCYVSWLRPGHRMVNFFYLVEVSVSARHITGQGSEYQL